MAQLTEDEFIEQLQGFGEDLRSGRLIDDILLEIVGDVVNQMKARAPVNSGALRNSITSLVVNNSLTISMLAYGLFQNYGVRGTQGGSADDVEEGVAPRPRSGNTYSFNPEFKMIGGPLPFGARVNIHRFGLKPQRFFNVDLIATQIEQELANRIEF